MRNRLLTLTAALALTALASWAPRAEASTFTIYCSDLYCAERSPEASCNCPPGTDKEGKQSTCEQWFSITAIGCWYE